MNPWCRRTYQALAWSSLVWASRWLPCQASELEQARKYIIGEKPPLSMVDYHDSGLSIGLDEIELRINRDFRDDINDYTLRLKPDHWSERGSMAELFEAESSILAASAKSRGYSDMLLRARHLGSVSIMSH